MERMLPSPNLDTTVPVLLFKARRSIIHHGALGVVRNLGQLGVPVYAIVDDRFVPHALSRHLTRSFILAATDLEAGRLLNRMETIARTLNRSTILVPTDDRGAIFIAEHETDLKRWFLFPNVASELPRQLANKMSLHAMCKKFGLPSPQNAFLKSLEEVHEFIKRATFPVIVKIAAQCPQLDSLPSTQIAETPEQLLTIYQTVQGLKDPTLIFQEYIPGDDWIVHGYCNQETNCLVSFTGRKLRSYPPFAGATALGVSVANELLASQIESFVNAVGYSGIMDIDCRFDKRDGKYKLLDFNPRLGMNFRMFDDQAGINVVRALHLDLTGKRVKRSPLVEGRIFIVEPFDLFACLGYLRRRMLTIPELLSSLRGSRELAWFSWLDPLPFFAMCIRMLPKLVSHLKQTLHVRTG
jgi:D-aspartate ligase